MDNIVTILPKGCALFNHMTTKYCLPPKVICNNTVVDGLFVNCGFQWNCNRFCATDTPYFVPVPFDGKFMLQTNFYHENNSTGWGDWIHIRLTDEKGEDIDPAITHLNFASQYMTGSTGSYSYQTIEINVSNITPKCFGFRIFTNEGDEICTQIFKKETCEELVTIEGAPGTYDCFNNYYGWPVGASSGTGPFLYSNKVYLNGMSKYYGGNVEIESNRVREYVRFYPSAKIAPFMMKYLLAKVLSAETVYLNENELENNGGGKYAPLEGGTMFFPLLEFETECTNAGICS
jgi:hypothetical protein